MALGTPLDVRSLVIHQVFPAVILEFAEPFAARLWRSSLLDVFLQVEAEEA